METFDTKYKKYEVKLRQAFKKTTEGKEQCDEESKSMEKQIKDSIKNIESELRVLDASLKQGFSRKINELTKEEI